MTLRSTSATRKRSLPQTSLAVQALLAETGTVRNTDSIDYERSGGVATYKLSEIAGHEQYGIEATQTRRQRNTLLADSSSIKSTKARNDDCVDGTSFQKLRDIELTPGSVSSLLQHGKTVTTNDDVSDIALDVTTEAPYSINSYGTIAKNKKDLHIKNEKVEEDYSNTSVGPQVGNSHPSNKWQTSDISNRSSSNLINNNINNQSNPNPNPTNSNQSFNGYNPTELQHHQASLAWQDPSQTRRRITSLSQDTNTQQPKSTINRHISKEQFLLQTPIYDSSGHTVSSKSSTFKSTEEEGRRPAGYISPDQSSISSASTKTLKSEYTGIIQSDSPSKTCTYSGPVSQTAATIKASVKRAFNQQTKSGTIINAPASPTFRNSSVLTKRRGKKINQESFSDDEEKTASFAGSVDNYAKDQTQLEKNRIYNNSMSDIVDYIADKGLALSSDAPIADMIISEAAYIIARNHPLHSIENITGLAIHKASELAPHMQHLLDTEPGITEAEARQQAQVMIDSIIPEDYEGGNNINYDHMSANDNNQRNQQGEGTPTRPSKPLVQKSGNSITTDIQLEHIRSGDISPPGEWFSLSRYADQIQLVEGDTLDEDSSPFERFNEHNLGCKVGNYQSTPAQIIRELRGSTLPDTLGLGYMCLLLPQEETQGIERSMLHIPTKATQFAMRAVYWLYKQLRIEEGIQARALDTDNATRHIYHASNYASVESMTEADSFSTTRSSFSLTDFASNAGLRSQTEYSSGQQTIKQIQAMRALVSQIRVISPNNIRFLDQSTGVYAHVQQAHKTNAISLQDGGCGPIVPINTIRNPRDELILRLPGTMTDQQIQDLVLSPAELFVGERVQEPRGLSIKIDSNMQLWERSPQYYNGRNGVNHSMFTVAGEHTLRERVEAIRNYAIIERTTNTVTIQIELNPLLLTMKPGLDYIPWDSFQTNLILSIHHWSGSLNILLSEIHVGDYSLQLKLDSNATTVHLPPRDISLGAAIAVKAMQGSTSLEMDNCSGKPKFSYPDDKSITEYQALHAPSKVPDVTKALNSQDPDNFRYPDMSIPMTEEQLIAKREDRSFNSLSLSGMTLTPSTAITTQREYIVQCLITDQAINRHGYDLSDNQSEWYTDEIEPKVSKAKRSTTIERKISNMPSSGAAQAAYIQEQYGLTPNAKKAMNTPGYIFNGKSHETKTHNKRLRQEMAKNQIIQQELAYQTISDTKQGTTGNTQAQVRALHELTEWKHQGISYLGQTPDLADNDTSDSEGEDEIKFTTETYDRRYQLLELARSELSVMKSRVDSTVTGDSLTTINTIQQITLYLQRYPRVLQLPDDHRNAYDEFLARAKVEIESLGAARKFKPTRKLVKKLEQWKMQGRLHNNNSDLSELLDKTSPVTASKWTDTYYDLADYALLKYDSYMRIRTEENSMQDSAYLELKVPNQPSTESANYNRDVAIDKYRVIRGTLSVSAYLQQLFRLEGVIINQPAHHYMTATEWLEANTIFQRIAEIQTDRTRYRLQYDRICKDDSKRPNIINHLFPKHIFFVDIDECILLGLPENEHQQSQDQHYSIAEVTLVKSAHINQSEDLHEKDHNDRRAIVEIMALLCQQGCRDTAVNGKFYEYIRIHYRDVYNQLSATGRTRGEQDMIEDDQPPESDSTALPSPNTNDEAVPMNITEANSSSAPQAGPMQIQHIHEEENEETKLVPLDKQSRKVVLIIINNSQIMGVKDVPFSARSDKQHDILTNDYRSAYGLPAHSEFIDRSDGVLMNPQSLDYSIWWTSMIKRTLEKYGLVTRQEELNTTRILLQDQIPDEQTASISYAIIYSLSDLRHTNQRDYYRTHYWFESRTEADNLLLWNEDPHADTTGTRLGYSLSLIHI